MSTLHIVLASASGLVLGYATAAHFGSRARALLASSLKREQERALKESKSDIKQLQAKVDELEEEEGSRDALSAKLAELEKRAKELEAERNQNSQAHTEALAALQAQLDEVKAGAGDAMSSELSTAIDAAKGGLDDILKALIEHEGQKAALLADASGIAIASAGDQDSIDRISAATSTLTGIPKQLDSVLPLGESFAYRLTDGKHAIAGRSFEADGDFMALTTFGDAAPSDAAISGALSSLRSALE